MRIDSLSNIQVQADESACGRNASIIFAIVDGAFPSDFVHKGKQLVFWEIENTEPNNLNIARQHYSDLKIVRLHRARFETS